MLSSFKEIISGVPQDSVAGLRLFNIFFLLIENASVHNFSDDHTLYCFAKATNNLVNLKKIAFSIIRWLLILINSNQLYWLKTSQGSLLCMHCLHRKTCKDFGNQLRQLFESQTPYQYYLKVCLKRVKPTKHNTATEKVLELWNKEGFT